MRNYVNYTYVMNCLFLVNSSVLAGQASLSYAETTDVVIASEMQTLTDSEAGF